MKNVTVSLDSILDSLRFLSSSNKRWLADHLIEQVAREEEAGTKAKAGYDLDDFAGGWSDDYFMDADELAEGIRNSRHVGSSREKRLQALWDEI